MCSHFRHIWPFYNETMIPFPRHFVADRLEENTMVRAEADQEALISFESGLPVANSVTLRKVVSLIVVIASRVKNA